MKLNLGGDNKRKCVMFFEQNWTIRLTESVCDDDDVGKAKKNFITLALYSLWSVTSGLRRRSPLTGVVVHAATFAVSAALVASQ